MTNRLILALLALLTGLSVQGSTVQARPMAAGTTQVAAVCALETVRIAKASAASQRPAPTAVHASRKIGEATVVDVMVVPKPGCLAGIDRAHE